MRRGEPSAWSTPAGPLARNCCYGRRGHIAILMTVLIAVLGVFLVVSLNFSEMTLKATRTENAADSAALTAATWQARGLNLIAGSNYVIALELVVWAAEIIVSMGESLGADSIPPVYIKVTQRVQDSLAMFINSFLPALSAHHMAIQCGASAAVVCGRHLRKVPQGSDEEPSESFLPQVPVERMLLGKTVGVALPLHTTIWDGGRGGGADVIHEGPGEVETVVPHPPDPETGEPTYAGAEFSDEEPGSALGVPPLSVTEAEAVAGCPSGTRNTEKRYDFSSPTAADAAKLADFLASQVDVFKRMAPEQRAGRIKVLLEALADMLPGPFTVKGGEAPCTIDLFKDDLGLWGPKEPDELPQGDWYGASEDALPLVSNVKVDVKYDFSMTISSRAFWEWPKGQYFYSAPVWVTDACARCGSGPVRGPRRVRVSRRPPRYRDLYWCTACGRSWYDTPGTTSMYVRPDRRPYVQLPESAVAPYYRYDTTIDLDVEVKVAMDIGLELFMDWKKGCYDPEPVAVIAWTPRLTKAGGWVLGRPRQRTRCRFTSAARTFDGGEAIKTFLPITVEHHKGAGGSLWSLDWRSTLRPLEDGEEEALTEEFDGWLLDFDLGWLERIPEDYRDALARLDLKRLCERETDDWLWGGIIAGRLIVEGLRGNERLLDLLGGIFE